MEVSYQLHTPPLYPLGKSPKYPLNRRLDGTPELLWMFWEDRTYLLLPEIEPHFIHPVD